MCPCRPFPGVRPCHHEAVIEKLQALRAADRKAKKRAVQEVAELRDNLQKQVGSRTGPLGHQD